MVWHPGGVRRLVLTLVWIASLTVACSIEDSPRDAAGPPTSSTTTPTSTTAGPLGDDPVPDASAAFVEIAGAAYDLDAECHAAGVGEIVITALTPGLIEPRIELYMQAFLAEPYVGISVTADGESVLHEPDLTIPFEIVQQGDVFRVDDVALVTDLDLSTGEATAAGTGTIVVECATYSDGLPPGYGSD